MPTPPPPVPFQKKRGGCFGCGCALGLFVLLLAILGGLGYLAATKLFGYTDTVSRPVPQFDGGEKIYDSAQNKLATFTHQQEEGQPSTLRLTSNEINTLIARNPSFAKYRGHVFVRLKGSEADLQSSLSLGSFQHLLEGRYLNFDATFGIDFKRPTKMVNFDLHHIRLHDQDLPDNTGASLSQSLAPLLNQELQAVPATRDFLNRTKTLTVENSELVIETQ